MLPFVEESENAVLAIVDYVDSHVVYEGYNFRNARPAKLAVIDGERIYFNDAPGPYYTAERDALRALLGGDHHLAGKVQGALREHWGWAG